VLFPDNLGWKKAISANVEEMKKSNLNSAEEKATFLF